MKLNNTLLLVFSISLLLYSLISDAKHQLKFYDPVIVKLKGTIKNLTFPGPPNYENINTGDDAEKCPYLILDQPIDVTTKQSLSENQKFSYADEKNIQLIQLAVGTDSVWPLMKDGKHVNVEGELYEAFTGHHHTRVLMYVKDAHKESSAPKHLLKNIRIQCEPDHGFCEIVLKKPSHENS